MAYDTEDAAVLLEDFGGTVTGPDGQSTLAILRERDEIAQEGLGDTKVRGTTLRIATAAPLELTRGATYAYREAPEDPPREFQLREVLVEGAFTVLLVSQT